MLVGMSFDSEAMKQWQAASFTKRSYAHISVDCLPLEEIGADDTMAKSERRRELAIYDFIAGAPLIRKTAEKPGMAVVECELSRLGRLSVLLR